MPFIPPKQALDGASAGLGLLKELINLARDAKRDKNHPLAINEIICSFPRGRFVSR